MSASVCVFGGTCSYPTAYGVWVCVCVAVIQVQSATLDGGTPGLARLQR